jgi:hypothetical protein
MAGTNTNRHRPAVNINRPRALKAREKGDPEGDDVIDVDKSFICRQFFIKVCTQKIFIFL